MRKILFHFTLLSALLVAIYFTLNIFTLKPKDIKKYHKILNRKAKLTSSKAFKRKPIDQKRTNVQKDIFLIQNNSRLHFRIFSKNSTLKITEKQSSIELIENLKNIKCFAQDKIHYNLENKRFEQKIRYFTAKEGTYAYPSHKFLTSSINLSFFDLPGKTLPPDINSFTPYLKGVAREVSFFLKDKSPKLNAHHFRASFDAKKELQ
jgi:hypothetical protein